MSYKHTVEKLADYRRQIDELRQKMRDVQAAVEPEAVKDYTFLRAGGGSVRLSELFGDKADLFVIHNMGQSCPYCTLWADGFNGAYAHLSNRAAFVLSSPDTPDKQRKFAESRHWTFPMMSHEGTTFAEDMGYRMPSFFGYLACSSAIPIIDLQHPVLMPHGDQEVSVVL